MTVSAAHRQLIVQELARQRAIVHIDLDCFYCQVEQLRLGLSPEIPLAVQQWQGLIAVNYPARERGVRRLDSVIEARQKCPDIRLVHVATFTEGLQPAYHPNPSVSTHKVSLDTYRRASRDIMALLKEMCPTMSKASIDEAYLDVSAVVQERILDGFDRGTIEWAADEDVMFAAEMGAEDKLPVPMVRWATVSRKGKERDTEGAMDLPSTTEFGVLVGEAVSVSIGWSDLQLRYAAEFANSLRARVFTELGYRSSAGIAHNRMLAKMGSALHKPNQQTVLRASQVSAFMHSLELSKIPSMGGKFGSVVESALDARNAGDVLVYSLDQLTLKLGKERAEHLYRVCQGVDDSEVVDRNEPQSLLTAKNFGRFPVRDMAHLERWLSMNGMDLWMRVVEEWEANKRWPRSLGVNYTTVGCKTRSKTVGFPLRHLQSAQTSPDAVVNAARACLVQIASAGHASSSGASSLMATNAQAGGPGLFPLAGFSLQAKGFQRDMASASVMDKWLSRSSAGKRAQPAVARAGQIRGPMSSTISKNSPPTSESEPDAGDEGNWNNPGYGHCETSDSDSDDQANDAPMMVLGGHGLPQLQAASMQSMMLRPSMAGMHIAHAHSNLHQQHPPQAQPQPQQQQQPQHYPLHHQAAIYGAAAHMAGTEVSSSASTPPLIPSRSHANRPLYGGSDPNLPMLNPGGHHAPRLVSRPRGLTFSSIVGDGQGHSSGYDSSGSDTSFLRTPPESGDETEEEDDEEQTEEDANADVDAQDTTLQPPASISTGSNSVTQSRRASIGTRNRAQNQSMSNLSTATGYTADSAGADNEGGAPGSSRSTVSSRRRTGVYIQPHVDTSSVSRYGEGYRHMNIDKNEDGSLEAVDPSPSTASRQHVGDQLIPTLISVSRRKRDVEIYRHFSHLDKPDEMLNWEEQDSGASTKARHGQGSGTRAHSRSNSVLQGPAEASFMASVRSRLEQTRVDHQGIVEGVLDLAVNAMNDSLSASQTEMYIRCPRCPPAAPTVSSSDWETHGDWHMARELQARELRNEDVSQEFRRAFNMDNESGSEKPPSKRARRGAESSAATGSGRRQQSLMEAWK